MKKLLVPTILLAILGTGCIVHTHGAGRRCPYPSTWNGNRCVNKQARRGNDTVIIRDHRR